MGNSWTRIYTATSFDGGSKNDDWLSTHLVDSLKGARKGCCILPEPLRWVRFRCSQSPFTKDVLSRLLLNVDYAADPSPTFAPPRQLFQVMGPMHLAVIRAWRVLQIQTNSASVLAPCLTCKRGGTKRP